MIAKIVDAGYNNIARSKIERVTSYEQHLIMNRSKKLNRRRTTGTAQSPKPNQPNVKGGRKSLHPGFKPQTSASQSAHGTAQPATTSNANHAQATTLTVQQTPTSTTTATSNNPPNSTATSQASSSSQLSANAATNVNSQPPAGGSGMVRVNYTPPSHAGNGQKDKPYAVKYFTP